MTATAYISAADTAKLVCAALKRAFPGQKFSVKTSTYSMGASIRVRWQDGPTQKMVDGVAKAFAGGRFDGSIDLASYVSHWLMPDGSVVLARDEGTVGSMGSRPAQGNEKPHPDAREVHFGANYVFCDRDLSPAFERQVLARLARQGWAQAKGLSTFAEAFNARLEAEGHWCNRTVLDLAHQEAAKLMIARA